MISLGSLFSRRPDSLLGIDISSSSLKLVELDHDASGKLVLKRGGAETDVEFPVNPPTTIGRFDPGVGPIDVDLGGLTPEGSYISRKHARITCEDGKFMIKDLGSSNGTFVLGDDFERVEEAELNDGTEIAFGNARFVFHTTTAETPLAD